MRTHRPRLAGPVVLAAWLGIGVGCDGSATEPPLVFRPSAEAAARIREARACERTGRLSEARTLYEEALTAEPRLGDARVQAGELARRTGHPEAAARHAETLLEDRPGHAGARVLLARVLAESEHRRARRVLEPVLTEAPEDPWVQVAAAEIALAGGDPSGAMGHLRSALKSDDDPRIRLDVGRGMASAGFHDDALDVVRSVLDQGDPTPDARYTLAWILENADRYAECIREYRALLRDHPDYLPPYRNLGALMARDGELPRAIRLWEKGLEQAPGDDGLRANVDEAMEALGLKYEGGRG